MKPINYTIFLVNLYGIKHMQWRKSRKTSEVKISEMLAETNRELIKTNDTLVALEKQSVTISRMSQFIAFISALLAAIAIGCSIYFYRDGLAFEKMKIEYEIFKSQKEKILEVIESKEDLLLNFELFCEDIETHSYTSIESDIEHLAIYFQPDESLSEEYYKAKSVTEGLKTMPAVDTYFRKEDYIRYQGIYNAIVLLVMVRELYSHHDEKSLKTVVSDLLKYDDEVSVNIDFLELIRAELGGLEYNSVLDEVNAYLDSDYVSHTLQKWTYVQVRYNSLYHLVQNAHFNSFEQLKNNDFVKQALVEDWKYELQWLQESKFDVCGLNYLDKILKLEKTNPPYAEQ